MKTRFISLTLLIFLTTIVGFTQESNENKLTDLAVQISHGKDIYPRYIQINEDNNGRSGLYDFGLLHKIPNFEKSQNRDSINQFGILSERIGDSVKIRILIVRVIENKRLEETVAEFTLAVNEKKVVNELKNIGFEPIEIKIIKVIPDSNRLPEIINNTSLLVTKVEAIYPTAPTYKITLMNNTSKSIKAVVYRQNTRNGAGGAGTISFGKNEGISPGMTKQITVANSNESVEIRKSRNNLPVAETTIVISSIIFEDNSYEGDESESANYVAPNMGYKIQAEKIIKILEENMFSEVLPANLKTQVENLSEVINEPDFIGFINKYPSLSKAETQRIRQSINQKISETRRNFLLKLEYLTNSKITLDQKWFEQEIENYKAKIDEN